MKKILSFIFTIFSIVSCTKEEPLSPQDNQILIDWITELKKSEWTYYKLQLGINEKWKFLNDSNIQSEKLEMETQL